MLISLLVSLLAPLCAIAWDKRVVAYFGRCCAPGNYPKLLPIIQQDSTITDLVLFVADLNLKGPPLTVLGCAPSNSTCLGPLWDQVGQLQAHGVNVIASFGGCCTEPTWNLLQHNFSYAYPMIKDFLQTYKLDGIDLDIEPDQTPGAQSTPSLASMVHFVKQLRSDFGDDFIITAAPVAQDLGPNPINYSGFSYKTFDDECVDSNGNKIINWYNAQFYNGYGNARTPKDYEAVVNNGFEPDRVVMLVPTALDEAGSGFFHVGVYEKTVAALAKMYPTFGGVGGDEWTDAGQNDSIPNWEWYHDVGSAL